MEEKNKIVKIALTGPESTGKSYTSEYLARFFDGWVVPEFAREYLDHLRGPYSYDDILSIARGQIDIEQKTTREAIAEDVDIIFFDSELINTQIWCEEKYYTCDAFITQAIVESDYDLYLLMRPDIEWEEDPLRENPHDRDRLFDLHIKYLEKYQKPYTIIDGDLKRRIIKAISTVKTFLLK